ncbi:hypothetical protein FF1_034490 [Malus domestica]
MWRKLWVENVPPKVKIGVWRIYKDIIPTKADMVRKQGTDSSWNNINSIEDWVLFLASHLSRSHFEICLMIFWAIWCARNDQLWKGGSKRQDIITLRAISWWLNFQKAQSHPSISRPLIPSMSWKKPHPGYVNINVDRAWKESEKCGGVGLG